MRVFLSHSTKEKADVQALRRALGDRGIGAWEDILELRLGDKLEDLRDAVRKSDAFVLLLSPASIGSDWVHSEVHWALEQSVARSDYRLLVLLRGMEKGVLRLLFGAAEPVCFLIPDEGQWIDEAVIEILRALGQAPVDGTSRKAPAPAPPMAELMLEFSQPRLAMIDGKPRAAGTLRLRYSPPAGRGSEGVSTEFVSPLGPTDAEDLRWYIESYCDWPWGPFKDRAREIEVQIQKWGKMLYDAIVAKQERPMRAFIEAKGVLSERLEKRITVNVEYRNADAEGSMAAALLFGLPWELLHDEFSYLFDGAAAIRVRRTLPSDNEQEPIEPRDRVRVLLVRARPEDDGAKFMDPRSSALPLAEVLHDLGEQVQLDVLHDGTLKALSDALTKAEDKNEPYQIVHFDGHGIYDDAEGIGKLCFEDAEDVENGLERRHSHNVSARELGGILRARRVPLFVLAACQSGMAEKNVDTSVAAELLRQGVASVVAMRYSVLVGTAHRFVRSFYESLAQGHRIGRAMLDAQRALKGNAVRADYGSLGRLELQDWMVPILFQENEDSQIFVRGIDQRPTADEDRKRVETLRRGALPSNPKHGFVGRERELLYIERRLVRKRRVTIVGVGGDGKTALAVEAADWFLLTRQRERVAFVSVERLSDARAVLDAIGRQLVPGYSVAKAEAGGNNPTIQVKSALLQRKTLLVVDNFESLLALVGKDPTSAEAVRDIVNLVHELADVGHTWLIATSRESLPMPLDGHELRLGSLDAREARELLVNVLREKGIEPPRERKSAEESAIVLTSLVEAVHRHARSLVLLGPSLAGRGIEATQNAIRREMVALDKLHPGDRERSLLASVRLSLSRLDEATRKKIAPLCVFRQAAPVPLMARVLEIEADEALDLGRQLVATGLADANGAYLLPDPALSAVLEPELNPTARAAAEMRWREGMRAFAGFLYQQQSLSARISVEGTTVALVDLLDALDATIADARANTVSLDAAMEFATVLEQLASNIGQPRALTHLRKAREALSKLLPSWSHAQCMAESTEIDRRLEAGDIQGALDRAKRLHAQVEAVGDAYSGAAYDRAMASFDLGRALEMAGQAAEALTVLMEAQNRFAALAAEGTSQAARMMSVVLVEQGDALRALGRLEAAAEAYEQAIQHSEARGDMRDIALARGQLGTVRLQQRRYNEALKAWEQFRQQFETLGDPANVAIGWHQIGIIHEQSGNFAAAEHAYKESLRMVVSLGNGAVEAQELAQLGTLYARQGRVEDAVSLYRKAHALFENIGDATRAAQTLNNLGIALQQLGRLDDAREALTAALSVMARNGHTAEPWKAWTALAQVELDAARPSSAAEARTQAIKTYRAYRLAGGEAMSGATRLVVDVWRLLRQQGSQAAGELLQKVRAANPDNSPHLGALFKALDAIVAGRRESAFAEDPAMDPIVAAELQMLLESISEA